MTKPSNSNIKKNLRCIYCNKKIDKIGLYVEIKCINAPEIQMFSPPKIFLYSHLNCFNKTT